MKEKNETIVQFLLSKEVKAYLLKIMQGKQASNLYTIFTGLSQRAKRAIKQSGCCPIDDDDDEQVHLLTCLTEFDNIYG
ncbi:hypothetical protein MAR_018315 [Mya arenaria]|uniref:Uncharacterized protein n=1 Tax=Mya arenaria TaxID=6604 RepID=A0ABY7EHD6_MYAAR|nr:hypothetical protein MAR_018315 [Mya arenaria]